MTSTGVLTTLARNLTIKTKSLELVKFRPNWAQIEFYNEAERQFRERGRVRIIVLKARQLGISTATEAMAFNLSFVFHGYRALVLAHEIPASRNLLEMTQRYWDTYPFKPLYTPKFYSKNDLGWVETDSAVNIATAGNKGAGRSSTIHFLHASEMAFYPDPKTVMTGLSQTIPEEAGTVVVAESTANGRGNYFHQQWLEAEQGETDYTPLFFPWWRHPEYRASHIGIQHRNLGKLSDTERDLKVRFQLDDDRLAWRRYAIRNKCQSDELIFMQEYPADPEEAFLATGMNVFPGEHLKACYQPEDGVRGILSRNGNNVEFKPASNGPLTLFRKPHANEDWGKYIVAGDPTRTTMGDYAVAQVLNRRTLEQVGVWRGRLDPVTFGEELFKLGLYFNTAVVTTEIEGPGYGTIGKLLGMNYPNVWQRQNKADKVGGLNSSTYGWSTTHQTKPQAIGWLLKHVVDHAVIIHDRKTYDEMTNYVTLNNGEYGNGNNEEHDDTVMSLAIAVTCHVYDAPLMAFGQEANNQRADMEELFNRDWETE